MFIIELAAGLFLGWLAVLAVGTVVYGICQKISKAH